LPDQATQPAPLDHALVAPIPCRPEDARAFPLDDVWCLRLPLPYQRTGFVNAYLLPGDDGAGWTLVDCGSAIGPGWESLLRALALAEVEPTAIDTLVLTHLHPDHASLAGTVVERLGCRLLRLDAPESGLDVLRDPRLDLDGRRRAALAQGVPPAILDDIVDLPLADDGRQPRPIPDALLAPGDLVAGRWRTVPLQGHSANQLGLFDAERRRLIGADVAYPGAPAYLEWGPTPDPWAEQLATFARVEALDAARLLPGHGPPDDAPAARFAAARAQLLRDGETIAAALAEGPGSAFAVAARLGHDPDPDGCQSRLSFALCVLDALVGAGAARVEVGPDDVRTFTAA
jgi:glyoxylase-like metal-dependent hydrolase (beta-lactamase superfamily II)